MTLTFNPVSATHWIKKKFWDYENTNMFKCHSTYLDNRFIDEAYHERMMIRKEKDPEGYQIYGLGDWGETGGLILTNYKIVELSKDQNAYDSVLYAQDFGFNHANCILELGFKDNIVHVLSEIYVNNMDASEIIDLANKKQVNKRRLMYCDSAEPERIKMWKNAGYRALPVKKEQNSVRAQIDYLQQYLILIDVSCVNTIKEIQQWSWIKNSTTGEYIDEPVNVFDDAMACLRYGIEPYRKNKRVKTLKNVL